MKVCILIPAHNEAKNIARLVVGIRELGLDVFVVDDGSSDATARIAEDSGAFVLVNQPNQGKGCSLQRGFDCIVSKDYDALITMDGDGQHAINDVPAFLKFFEIEKPDIICGNRMRHCHGMPFFRRMTNWFMSALISFVCRQRVYDTQCGFRLIKTDVLRKIQLSSMAFEIESEVLIKAARQGCRIASVDVQTIYAGEKSRINPFRDTVRFVIYIFRELFGH